MKTTCWAACSLAMWALVGATSLLADTHFVSLTGSNLWPYASWGSAATSIQDAVDTAVSGDTVLVGDGRYMLLSAVVIDGKSITLKSANGATAVTIDGQYPALSQRCILVQNVTNAILMGFTIANGCIVTSGYGGGVSFSGGGRIQNCVFTNNHAATGSLGGGGLLAVGGCAVVDCSFLSNYASGGGGGAWVESPSSVERCVFVGNSSSAGNGGALYITGGGASGPLVRNCLLYSNHSAYNGGGVYGQGVLENCTIATNSSDTAGGGVEGNWNLSTYNCIIFFNTAPTSPNYSASGYFYSCCTTPQVPDSRGTGNFKLNPGFANISINDFRLSPNSPCVNTGNNQDWMATSTDFLGNPRLVNGVVDRGAYESPSGSSPVNGVTVNIDTGVELIWNSQAGVRYWIQASDDLSNANSWQTIDQQTGNGGEMSAMYSARNQSHRFYKITAGQ